MDGKKTANYIRSRREALGLTQDELSAQLGVSRLLIEQWEEGELPETQYLLPLSKTLQCEIEDILIGIKTPTAETTPKETPQTDEKPKAKQQEKSYYEELREKVREIPPQEEIRSGHNGFYRQERWLIGIVCAFFALLIAINLFSTASARFGKHSNITADNCRNYVNVNVYATQVFNPEEYIVCVSGRGKIVYNLDITVELLCRNMITGDSYTKQVSFSDNELSRNEKLEKTVSVPDFMYDVSIGRILSAEGRVKA